MGLRLDPDRSGIVLSCPSCTYLPPSGFWKNRKIPARPDSPVRDQFPSILKPLGPQRPGLLRALIACVNFPRFHSPRRPSQHLSCPGSGNGPLHRQLHSLFRSSVFWPNEDNDMRGPSGASFSRTPSPLWTAAHAGVHSRPPRNRAPAGVHKNMPGDAPPEWLISGWARFLAFPPSRQHRQRKPARSFWSLQE